MPAGSELVANPEIVSLIQLLCDESNLVSLYESDSKVAERIARKLLENNQWRNLSESATDIWEKHDFVILRGLPPMENGSSLLVASHLFAGPLKKYRGTNIVKTFRMSPWTEELSHTLKEGFFHTDLNTDPSPPALTCIQCLVPDPGFPKFGLNRVARLADVLSFCTSEGMESVLEFLTETPVAMIDDHSQSAFEGSIVENGRVRYHPETLRAAVKRHRNDSWDLENMLAEIHDAAMSVSTPFSLEAGDVLFVSNHRALHYRGECSVAFDEFPLDYRARVIHVLHKLDEPKW